VIPAKIVIPKTKTIKLRKAVAGDKQSTKCANPYLVEKGNSIEGIARKCEILPYQLREANNLRPGAIIHPDDKLKIPKVKWASYEGCASWYGPGFHGKTMANGETYNQDEFLIAHRHLPFGTKVKITVIDFDGKLGDSIVVSVKDRGPYIDDKKCPREVDLSRAVAKKLKVVVEEKLVAVPVGDGEIISKKERVKKTVKDAGVVPVKIEPLPSKI